MPKGFMGSEISSITSIGATGKIPMSLFFVSVIITLIIGVGFFAFYGVAITMGIFFCVYAGMSILLGRGNEYLVIFIVLIGIFFFVIGFLGFEMTFAELYQFIRPG